MKSSRCLNLDPAEIDALITNFETLSNTTGESLDTLTTRSTWVGQRTCKTTSRLRRSFRFPFVHCEIVLASGYRNDFYVVPKSSMKKRRNCTFLARYRSDQIVPSLVLISPGRSCAGSASDWKSTLRAHQMAPPRTSQDVRDASPVPCFVSNQGTERAMDNFVVDAVADTRRTPERHDTGGVPPKPPATILLSLWPSVFWDFGSLCQRRCGVIS